MKAFCIVIEGNETSELGYQRLVRSIEDSTAVNLDNVEKFTATVPETIDEGMKEAFGRKVPWTWPKAESENHRCIHTGLDKSWYRAEDYKRVVACAVSHARLWKKCSELNETIAIFEHDAIFSFKGMQQPNNTKVHFYPDKLNAMKWGALSLNDPIGCTRKGKIYSEMLKDNDEGQLIQEVPNIDLFTMVNPPNGMPGNSAYMIKPFAAREALDKVKEIGLWPNDALLCKQLFPWVRVAYPYYTTVRSEMSTTTRM